jgi:hypothetical protein
MACKILEIALLINVVLDDPQEVTRSLAKLVG